LSAFIDTNILVRHLTGDPPRRPGVPAPSSSKPEELLLSDSVAAEVVYV
jgi:predicted nucleic acid-binding protein